MKRMEHVLIMGLCLAVIFLTDAGRVHASLGETVESVSSDQEALSASRMSTSAHNGYTIHEIDTGSASVREFVSSSGIVFGIAWSGRLHPDLTQLLGPYAGEYEEALKQTRRVPGRRRLKVNTDNIIVQKWGHMRNLRGRAYAPGLIPIGVRIDEIL